MKTYIFTQQHHTDDTAQPVEICRVNNLKDAQGVMNDPKYQQFEVIDENSTGKFTVGFQAQKQGMNYFVNRVVVEVVDTELSEV